MKNINMLVCSSSCKIITYGTGNGTTINGTTDDDVECGESMYESTKQFWVQCYT